MIFAHCDKVFGLDDKLPWKFIKNDMEHFKNYTKDSEILMGPKTFQSLPKKLKGRTHHVILNEKRDNTPTLLAKDGSVPDKISYIKDLNIEYMRTSYNTSYVVIGGISLIKYFINHCSEISMTEIKESELRKLDGNVIKLDDDTIDKLNSLFKVNFKKYDDCEIYFLRRNKIKFDKIYTDKWQYNVSAGVGLKMNAINSINIKNVSEILLKESCNPVFTYNIICKLLNNETVYTTTMYHLNFNKIYDALLKENVQLEIINPKEGGTPPISECNFEKAKQFFEDNKLEPIMYKDYFKEYKDAF